MRSAMNTRAPMAHLYFLGDISFGRRIDQRVERYGADFLLKEVAASLGEADVVFANLECPLSLRGIPVQRLPLVLPNGMVYETVALRGRPEAAAALKRANIGVVSLANNHIYDYGPEALADTLQALDQAGILYAGVGQTVEKAYEPVILSVQGISLAFLAFTMFAPEAPPGMKNFALGEPARMYEAVNRVKEFAEVVIVSVHWGEEDCHYPFPNHVDLAHGLIDRGADLVVGHHPHVLQGLEQYKQGWVAYSLGNFLFDEEKPARRRSIILRCDVNREGIASVDWVALEMNEQFQPTLATTSRAQEINDSLLVYSQMFQNPNHPAWLEMANSHNQRSIAALWRSGFWESLTWSLRRLHRVRLGHLRELGRLLSQSIRQLLHY